LEGYFSMHNVDYLEGRKYRIFSGVELFTLKLISLFFRSLCEPAFGCIHFPFFFF
jgi:hypothetical protein